MSRRHGFSRLALFLPLLLSLLLLLLLLLSFDSANLASAFLDDDGCNRTVRNSVGWIRWTGRMGKCIIRIKAPSKDPQVIELKIRRMQVGYLNKGRCEGAYFQISNELEDLDESSGRYCGHETGNSTRLFLRHGPDMTVLLFSEAQFAEEIPVIFSAQFSILPARLASERHQQRAPASLAPDSSDGECPLECFRRNDRRTCRLLSPGYPGVYPRGLRCRLALESEAGSFRVGGGPEDRYSIMNGTSQQLCRTELCEQEHVRPAEPRPSADQPRRTDRDEEDEIIIGQEEPELGLEKPRVRLGKKRRRSKQPRLHADKSRRRSSLELLETDDLEGTRLTEFGAAAAAAKPRNERLFWSTKSRQHQQQQQGQQQHRQQRRRHEPQQRARTGLGRLGSGACVGDYLALLESLDGRLLEIGRFCGEGRFPRILTRGRELLVEFHARRDGTILHSGFHLSIQEAPAPGTAAAAAGPGCDLLLRSSERARDGLESPRSWYPPGTLCSYRFAGRPGERVSLLLRILRAEEPGSPPPSPAGEVGPAEHCPGNEIAVYNASQPAGGALVWSFCDAAHADINNIQVPILSSGSELLVQFYSATGSYNGLDFTFSMTYKFVKKPANATRRRQASAAAAAADDGEDEDETRLISLRPVDFSALNLSESDGCNCDFADRIGNFKSWFVVLVVLGVISFLGAILTIVALLVKCAKMRAAENKLLQTPNRSIYFKNSSDE